MLEQVLLILIAISPGLIISYLIYRQDRYDKEPRRLLILCFLLGILITYPAMKLEGWLESFSGTNYDQLGPLLFTSFIVVGLIEELVKFIALYLYPYRHRAFNEPLDGIVYAVMIGMGFATLENLLYADRYGMRTILFRALTAVPAHGVFAVIMGYYAGLAKFNPSKRKLLIFKSILFAILIHGLYDFFILQDFYEWIMAFATVILFVGIYLSILMIRAHQEDARKRSLQIIAEQDSPQAHEEAPPPSEEIQNDIMDAVIDDMKKNEEEE